MKLYSLDVAGCRLHPATLAKAATPTLHSGLAMLMIALTLPILQLSTKPCMAWQLSFAGHATT